MLFWWSQLDERYLVEVRPLREHLGRLLMFDHAAGDALVYETVVLLRLGAAFGPSIEDVDDWQERSEAWADARPADVVE